MARSMLTPLTMALREMCSRTRRRSEVDVKAGGRMRATTGKPTTAVLLRSFVRAMTFACSLALVPGAATAAVTATELTTGADGANGASYVTASISPTANTLILAWVTNSRNSSPATPTLSGNGLTWVQVTTVAWGTIATPTWRTTLFRAMGASPTSGAVTITVPGNATGCLWSIQQFGNVDTSGTDGSGAVVQAASNATDSNTSLSVTLAPLANATNATAGGFSNVINALMVIDLRYSKVGVCAISTPMPPMAELRLVTLTVVIPVALHSALWLVGGLLWVWPVNGV